MNLRIHNAHSPAAAAGLFPRYGATIDARLPSEVRPDSGRSSVRVELEPELWNAMRAAGKEVVDRLTAGRSLAVVMGIDGALETLGTRAAWACWLLAARQRMAELPPADDRQLVLPGTAVLADAAVLAHVTGLWRLMAAPTPMGDDATGWSFLIARWVIAPLLPPSQTATFSDWYRVLREGGERRRSARVQARLAVTDALASERRAGTSLWAELCRSQFVHPMQVLAVGNIIRGETDAALPTA